MDNKEWFTGFIADKGLCFRGLGGSPQPPPPPPPPLPTLHPLPPQPPQQNNPKKSNYLLLQIRNRGGAVGVPATATSGACTRGAFEFPTRASLRARNLLIVVVVVLSVCAVVGGVGAGVDRSIRSCSSS